ncbi:putative transcription factor bHLH family [Helianthus annuus]|uniref:Putative myc-type, basic helix-loop-helix (BHLH) domain-containing protein n=2 Tax=Helianthus annuus TaxID=4232 RepID=A0A251TDQ1_HELAN|nr:putative transcription factor bHLH family [Helianthus annuus]KAJ0518848.1 putative transcription factor bHLH family [Helianthus annuus]
MFNACILVCVCSPPPSPYQAKKMDSSEYAFSHFNGGNFNMFQPDFMPEETDFDTLISAIRSEPAADPTESYYLDYGYNHFTNSCTELPVVQPLYGHNDDVLAAGADFGGYEMMDPNSGLVWNQGMEDMKAFCDDDSSESVPNDKAETTKSTGNGSKADRARTLISERKRRSGMKEKLYALRSLVPNITKMDKASIVGDAARYIQDLQTQSKNLRAEIATIEATKALNASSSQNSEKVYVSHQFPTPKKISKLDMFQVEEKGYYVRLICNKGRSVAASLHRALESITSFQVQSSNLSTVDDDFVLTFTLDVTAYGFDINLANLKLWLSSAFINQGFEFNTFP